MRPVQPKPPGGALSPQEPVSETPSVHRDELTPKDGFELAQGRRAEPRRSVLSVPIQELTNRVERALEQLMALLQDGEREPTAPGVSPADVEAARAAVQEGKPLDPELVQRILPLAGEDEPK